MEPNYSECSLDELRDTLAAMDEKAFPERAAKLRQALQSKELSDPNSVRELESDFDQNEQFYACPSCEGKIGIFSKTMNKWGKIKTCPHCGEPFTITTNFTFLAYIFIPAMIIHFFLLKPLLVAVGVSSTISIVIVAVSTVTLSKRFTKVQSNKAT